MKFTKEVLEQNKLRDISEVEGKTIEGTCTSKVGTLTVLFKDDTYITLGTSLDHEVITLVSQPNQDVIDELEMMSSRLPKGHQKIKNLIDSNPNTKKCLIALNELFNESTDKQSDIITNHLQGGEGYLTDDELKQLDNFMYTFYFDKELFSALSKEMLYSFQDKLRAVRQCVEDDLEGSSSTELMLKLSSLQKELNTLIRELEYEEEVISTDPLK